MLATASRTAAAQPALPTGHNSCMAQMQRASPKLYGIYGDSCMAVSSFIPCVKVALSLSLSFLSLTHFHSLALYNFHSVQQAL
jgi:hypothetical protein